MTYYPPAHHNEVAFDLVGGGYAIPEADAANFALYVALMPEPMDFMCTRTHGSFNASASFATARAHHHDGTVPTKARQVRHLFRLATERRRMLAQAWDKLRIVDASGLRGTWEEGTPLAPAGEGHNIHHAAHKDRGDRHQWDDVAPRQDETDQAYNVPAVKDFESRAPHVSTALHWEPPAADSVRYFNRPGHADFSFQPAAGQGVPGAFVVDLNLLAAGIVDWPTRPINGTDAQPWGGMPGDKRLHIRHPWDTKPRLGTEIDFDFDTDPDPVDHQPPEQPEIRGSYYVMNNASMIEVSTGTPLAFQDLEIGLDLDSFSWTCSATIMNAASMNLIKPTATGPAEIAVAVNGQAWRFIVESYSTDRAFGREQYRISAVSRTQFLAAPYAPLRTRRFGAQINAQGVIGDELLYTGYTITWASGLPDFLIPADAWGYENKTPIEVISEIAAAAGAVVVPALDVDVLHIRPRYRVSPWALGAIAEAELDAIITDTMTMAYSAQWSPKPLFDAVHVSGISAGVAVDVIRTGYPGTDPAPDVYDALNVEAAQCGERGRAILCASGNQEIVSIDTPLPTSGAPGLIIPGDVVEWRDTINGGAGTWRGIVLENRISVSQPGAARVIQRLQIERHYY